MAIKGNRLKPAELVRLLNSTDLGTVVSPAQVYRHFTQAGYRVASSEDTRCLNLYRYIAWLVDRKNTVAQMGPSAYEAHLNTVMRRDQEMSLSGRDIGDLPPVADPERKEACRYDFRLTRAANSGVKYFIDETQNGGSAEEYQILENVHPDSDKGVDGGRRTAAVGRSRRRAPPAAGSQRFDGQLLQPQGEGALSQVRAICREAVKVPARK